MREFSIDERIERAATLPSWVYSDPEVHAAQRERIFARSWQPVGDTDRVRVLGQVSPAVFLEGKIATSAGNAIDRVEREDEAVVEAVQRGVRSRIYHRGRYSPTRETGVRHFHRLMAEALA